MSIVVAVDFYYETDMALNQCRFVVFEAWPINIILTLNPLHRIFSFTNYVNASQPVTITVRSRPVSD